MSSALSIVLGTWEKNESTICVYFKKISNLVHFKQLNPKLDLICRQTKLFQEDFSFCINNQTKVTETNRSLYGM